MFGIMSVRGPGLFLRRVLGTNTASGMGTRFCGGRSTPLGRSAKLSGGAVCRNCSLNVCRDLSLLEVRGNECPSAPGIVAKSSFFSRAFVLGVEVDAHHNCSAAPSSGQATRCSVPHHRPMRCGQAASFAFAPSRSERKEQERDSIYLFNSICKVRRLRCVRK